MPTFLIYSFTKNIFYSTKILVNEVNKVSLHYNHRVTRKYHTCYNFVGCFTKTEDKFIPSPAKTDPKNYPLLILQIKISKGLFFEVTKLLLLYSFFYNFEETFAINNNGENTISC